MELFESLNVFGKPLVPCSYDPLTGFVRDGHCQTCHEDSGIHTVCVVMTEEFLHFSKSKGNDLSTPNLQFNFPGVKPGERWCLCAGRWVEAYQAGKAPQVVLEATHLETLGIIPLALLSEFAYK
jgi:uncharacterized protein (DUF2237 family)